MQKHGDVETDAQQPDPLPLETHAPEPDPLAGAGREAATAHSEPESGAGPRVLVIMDRPRALQKVQPPQPTGGTRDAPPPLPQKEEPVQVSVPSLAPVLQAPAAAGQTASDGSALASPALATPALATPALASPALAFPALASPALASPAPSDAAQAVLEGSPETSPRLDPSSSADDTASSDPQRGSEPAEASEPTERASSQPLLQLVREGGTGEGEPPALPPRSVPGDTGEDRPMSPPRDSEQPPVSWPITQYGVFRDEPVFRRTELDLMLPVPTPPRAEKKVGGRLRLLMVGLVLLLLCLARLNLLPSGAQPATAPADEFSAHRALEQVKPLVVAPRALGGEQLAKARAHLITVLEGLGLSVEEEQSISSAQNGSRATVATVSNIVARLPGTSPEGAILLMSHYDSVPTSPGASDSAVGVAAILETLRALKAGPPLKQDILVLLTDGEEAGLLGARAFAKTLPLRREVKAILNLDARGTRGAAIMFETVGPVKSLLETYQTASSRPLSSSLIHELYLNLPNDTDLSAFRVSDVPGLNFAYAEGLAAYHSSEDTLDRVDPDSVQHLGEQALAVTRALGSEALKEPGKGNWVMFNLVPWILIRYPVWVAFPLAILGAVLTGVCLLLGLQRSVLNVRGLAWGVTLPLVASLITGAAGTIAWPLLLRNTGEYVMFYSQGDTWHSMPYALALSLITLALLWLLQRTVARRAELQDLIMGGLVLWSAASVYLVVKLPLGSYVLSWPLLLGALAMAIWLARQPVRYPDLFPESLEDDPFLQDPDRADEELFLTLSAGVVGALLFITPAIMVLYFMSSLQIPGLIAAPSALVGVFAVPWLRILVFPWKRLSLLVFLLLAFGPPILVMRADAFDAAYPEPVSLLYLFDADQQASWWVSMDEAPSAWNASALGEQWERRDLSELVPELNFQVLAAEAPRWPRPAPHITRLEELTEEGMRIVRLRITPRGSSQWIDVTVDARAQLARAAVSLPGGGRPAEFQPPPGRSFRLRVFAPPDEGFELELEAPQSELLMLRAVEVWPGFPGLADGAPLELMGPPEKGEIRAPFQPDQIPGPLPSGAMLRPAWLNRTTLVSVGYSF